MDILKRMYEYLSMLKQKSLFVSMQATLSPEEQEEFDAWRTLYNEGMLEGDLIDVALPDLPGEQTLLHNDLNSELLCIYFATISEQSAAYPSTYSM